MPGGNVEAAAFAVLSFAVERGRIHLCLASIMKMRSLLCWGLSMNELYVSDWHEILEMRLLLRWGLPMNELFYISVWHNMVGMQFCCPECSQRQSSCTCLPININIDKYVVVVMRVANERAYTHVCMALHVQDARHNTLKLELLFVLGVANE